MRNHFALLFSALIIFTATSQLNAADKGDVKVTPEAKTTVENNKKDCCCKKSQEEINSLLKEFIADHETNNVNKLMDLFSDGKIVVYGTSEGEKYLDKKSLRAALEKQFKDVKSTRIETLWQDIRVKGPVAWTNVDYRFTTELPDGTKKNFIIRSTMILNKEGSDWKIVSSHFSLPAVDQPYEQELRKIR